jgi:leucyl-tRNA synthetase
VERKLMKQWSLRITAYAQRLLDGLETVDWPDSLKEMQRNWIGRSEGASVWFKLDGHDDDEELAEGIEVFTTRPDTLFGATFMVLAPEHEWVSRITTAEHKEKVEAYVQWAKNRSERERMTEVKKVTGEFTGAYAVNPLTGEKIPVWIADYVLSGYGTGAIMAVPGHDSRDFAFARHFNLPIIQVVRREGEEMSDVSTWVESFDSKEGILVNSGFLNGMNVKEAIHTTIEKLEAMGIGKGKINFRLRDAIFSRQRYWGEPFPMYYKDGMPYPLPEDELPLRLPEVDKYLPTETGEPPVARAKNWKTKEGYPLETNTMPGFAGSSGYYLRYMDPHNDKEYFSQEANQYWRNVDLYIGGDEHAAGHLIYSRVWNKFLYDNGLACEDEPFKKLINQGKIQGRSNFVYRITGTNKFVSYNLRKEYNTQALHVDIEMVSNDVLDTEAFRKWRPEFQDAEFILEDGKYICGYEVEKMSKSKHNVQNPDDLIEKYGADTLRLYEMFLGPIDQDKPWDINGIEGVYRFLRKLWRLYFDEEDQLVVTDEPAVEAELKVIHKTIKKIRDDIERFSFNTGVSAFMICVNELTELNCHKREMLESLSLLMEPYAPHLAEELWESLGHKGSIVNVDFPEYDLKYLQEDTFTYPVSFNGKMRFKLELPIDMPVPEIEKAALSAQEATRWLEGKTVRKIIVVPGRIVNIVVG